MGIAWKLICYTKRLRNFVSGILATGGNFSGQVDLEEV